MKRIRELLREKALLQIEILIDDLKGSGRDEVVKKFKSFDFGALIATDVVARNFDVAGVFLVVNFECPCSYYRGRRDRPSCDTYQHRAGRCGRWGRRGLVVNIIHNSKEMDDYKQICKELNLELFPLKPEDLDLPIKE